MGALVLTALIFWADTVTPTGVAVPTLYVAPILLFMMGGEYWEPLLVAAGATLLIVAGVYVTPGGGSATFARGRSTGSRRWIAGWRRSRVSMARIFIG